MKIAIKGHPSRGKEVIQILRDLGGKNNNCLSGDSNAYYYINSDLEGTIQCHSQTYVNRYCKKYTLEEFEKDFPFKLGDKIMDCSDNEIGTITNLIYINNILMYNVDFVDSGQAFMLSDQLKPYKEMKKKKKYNTYS